LKHTLLATVIILSSCFAYGQSTCMSRCEVVFGVNDSRCPDICQHHPDGLKKPKRKKAEVDATSASKAIESSSSASQAQQTQVQQPQVQQPQVQQPQVQQPQVQQPQVQQPPKVEKKPTPATAASSAQASKEKQ
jgi:hypothetical protein